MNRRAFTLALASILISGRAFALQPLREFLDGAQRLNVDQREAAWAAVARDQEALSTLGHVLPSLTAHGSYTRNQFDVRFTVGDQSLVVSPLNQWDGTVEADVPLVDLAGWLRARAARQSAKAAQIGERVTLLDVQKQVARSYYQLVGAAALRQSAEDTLVVAQANHKLTVDQLRAGTGTELDVQRAAAEVERARQLIADAELSMALAHRTLGTLTGVRAAEPFDGTADDLHDEAALEAWERTGEHPATQAAAEQRKSAESVALAAKFGLLPVVSGWINEHGTNAPGFIPDDHWYTAGVGATWHFDLSSIADIRAQSANAEVARVREERVRLQVGDAIHESWQRVRAGIVVSRSARAQFDAAKAALTNAQQRYAGGVSTQLEVIQAQRDASAADVARIQADANLSFARSALRLDAGRALEPN